MTEIEDDLDASVAAFTYDHDQEVSIAKAADDHAGEDSFEHPIAGFALIPSAQEVGPDASISGLLGMEKDGPDTSMAKMAPISSPEVAPVSSPAMQNYAPDIDMSTAGAAVISGAQEVDAYASIAGVMPSVTAGAVISDAQECDPDASIAGVMPSVTAGVAVVSGAQEYDPDTSIAGVVPSVTAGVAVVSGAHECDPDTSIARVVPSVDAQKDNPEPSMAVFAPRPDVQEDSPYAFITGLRQSPDLQDAPASTKIAVNDAVVCDGLGVGRLMDRWQPTSFLDQNTSCEVGGANPCDGSSPWGNWAAKPGPSIDAGKWQADTAATLDHARNLVQHALSVHQENSRTKEGATHKNISQTAAVQHTIRKKIGATRGMVRGITDHIDIVDDEMQQLGQCLFVLQRAHRSKWSLLNICERRLELRALRPLQELVSDRTQLALEHERQTLIEARQELADQIEACKEMLTGLEDLKGELMLDMSHKRHGQRIDQACLSSRAQKPIGKSPEIAKERMVLPRVNAVAHYDLPPSPKSAERGSGDRQEGGRSAAAQALLFKALKMEEDARRLRKVSDVAMLQTKLECTGASKQTAAALAERSSTIAEFRQRLEAQLQETHQAIVATEKSMAETQRQMYAHEQPLRILDSQFVLRAGRTSREGIRDPVTEEMEAHLDSVKQSVQALQEKWEASKEVLQQLNISKACLAEDLRCKVAAQKLEDACLRVTPRKSMELDRADPRGGRVGDRCASAGRSRGCTSPSWHSPFASY